jgi:hypothetical protein
MTAIGYDAAKWDIIAGRRWFDPGSARASSLRGHTATFSASEYFSRRLTTLTD